FSTSSVTIARSATACPAFSTRSARVVPDLSSANERVSDTVRTAILSGTNCLVSSIPGMIAVRAPPGSGCQYRRACAQRHRPPKVRHDHSTAPGRTAGEQLRQLRAYASAGLHLSVQQGGAWLAGVADAFAHYHAHWRAHRPHRIWRLPPPHRSDL